MSQWIATSNQTAIVGAGVTGVSVARFLLRNGQGFTLLDTQADHPKRAALEQEFGLSNVYFGPLDAPALARCGEVVVSPGVAMSTPALEQARSLGARLVGDIELFARHAQAPIVAITGSNAKSTVTTLVGQMAREAGKNVAVGGNLGTAALDLLDAQVELYVLELSSFQLEAVTGLNARVATVLNISADHMDRYADESAYRQVKLRVYEGAQQIVFNSQSALTQPPMAAGEAPITFGGPAAGRRFGLLERDGEPWLSWQWQPLMAASDLPVKGRHNVDNALAALALGYGAGLAIESMLATLRRFNGLPHRCEWVAEHDGVAYYNDSKGTNLGAAITAIEGLAPRSGKVVLIAGGEAKGADFSPLRRPAEQWLSCAVLIGRAAKELSDALAGAVATVVAETLVEAVDKAKAAAQPGDVVLLSPACASFDMFADYRDRGDQFRRAVEALT